MFASVHGARRRCGVYRTTCDSCSKPAVLEQAYSEEYYAMSTWPNRFEKIGRELRHQLKTHVKETRPSLCYLWRKGCSAAGQYCRRVGKQTGRENRYGTVDEGIEGYRPPSLLCAQELCERLGVEFITVSYPELNFKEMDEVAAKIPGLAKENKHIPRMPCSYCGVFRRQGINHLAKKVNADYVALGHNLDNMAQTVLMNMTNGDLERTLRLAPHTTTTSGWISTRIVPLRWIPEQEIQLYALYRNLPLHHEECPHGQVLYDGDIETWLLKWNRMYLGHGMGSYEWQTTSNSFETKSSI